jgi:hypothetical protein
VLNPWLHRRDPRRGHGSAEGVTGGGRGEHHPCYSKSSNLENVANYSMANGLPNRIPNKGHLNLPCFARHAKDGSTI